VIVEDVATGERIAEYTGIPRVVFERARRTLAPHLAVLTVGAKARAAIDPVVGWLRTFQNPRRKP
jgi:hypothetical protein